MQELIGLICMWFVCVKQNNGITHFDSFGVAYIPKEIMRFIGDKNVTTNIFEIHVNDSLMCGCFGVGFTNHTDYTDYIDLFMIFKRMTKWI